MYYYLMFIYYLYTIKNSTAVESSTENRQSGFFSAFFYIFPQNMRIFLITVLTKEKNLAILFLATCNSFVIFA